jgi:hypothetical protein
VPAFFQQISSAASDLLGGLARGVVSSMFFRKKSTGSMFSFAARSSNAPIVIT